MEWKKQNYEHIVCCEVAIFKQSEEGTSLAVDILREFQEDKGMRLMDKWENVLQAKEKQFKDNEVLDYLLNIWKKGQSVKSSWALESVV